MAAGKTMHHAPRKRPRAVLLVDGSRQALADRAADLRSIIEQHLEIAGAIDDLGQPLPQVAADIAVVFGGDGSILRAARQMGFEQIPVLGVNLGRLGFLADIQPEELDAILPQIVAGQYRVVGHLMFECSVHRSGVEQSRSLGLNEVAVLAGPPFSMIEVQLYVDADLATTYSCDGLIVSTPVGSTAHSLAAGGPIMQKSLQTLVVSPICPHTLTNRPVVDGADHVFELAVPKPNEGTSLLVDGKLIGQISAQDRVRIERSTAQFQLVEVRGRGYYRTLREKLGWGGRLKLNE
ncbi:MAG: NAD(+) kinase [Planctomycetota bacterium]|nr:MAG: NAD(+) kinase [Planctomycetota bacterium]